MSTITEDRLRITVEALPTERGDGTPVGSGTPGSIDLSPELAREAVEALRAKVAERFDWWLGVLLLHRYGDPDRPETKLDFTAPNTPTREQIAELLLVARRVVGALEVLHELAPWTDEDDDTDDEPQLGPVPANESEGP